LLATSNISALRDEDVVKYACFHVITALFSSVVIINSHPLCIPLVAQSVYLRLNPRKVVLFFDLAGLLRALNHQPLH